MGAYFYSPGTNRIRYHLRRYFNEDNIKTTAKWASLFDPSQKDKSRIYDALKSDKMNLPPVNDPHFGPKLQERFILLFMRMVESDTKWKTNTHDEIRQAVFEALTEAATTPPSRVKPIKFYLAHQSAAEPFSPTNPEYRFVKWYEEDDNGRGAHHFLFDLSDLARADRQTPAQDGRQKDTAAVKKKTVAKKKPAIKAGKTR